jgi:hypothetical protein
MGDLIGGIIGGAGQYAAAKEQAKAAEKAAQLALTGYNYLTKGEGAVPNQGYIDAGSNANNMIAGLLGVPGTTDEQKSAANSAFNNYLNSTAYNFQLQQGQDAITGSAAAKGLLNSGATAKALTQYGQNLAGTTFNNYLGQLGNLSAAGQNALTRTSNAGGAGGGGAGSAMIAAGNAQASGITGLANSIGTAVGGLFNSFNSGGGSNVFPPAPTLGGGGLY